MAKKKNPADAAKDKAAKQKKIAILLVCVLALAMAYAVHTMMAMSGSASASKPQAVDPSTATTTTPVATPDPTAAAAPSLAGAPVAAAPTATPTADGSTAGSSQLLAVVTPPADPGQLDSFSRFESKDPFAGGGGASASGATASTSSSGGGSGGSTGSSSSSPPAVPPAPPNPPPTSAVISVNGLGEQVSTGGIFPTTSTNTATNGLFELVSLTLEDGDGLGRRRLLRQRVADAEALGEQAGDAREHGRRDAVHARALPAGHGSPRRSRRARHRAAPRRRRPTRSDDHDPDHGRLAQAHPERCPTLNRGRAPFSIRPRLPIPAVCACVAVSVPV